MTGISTTRCRAPLSLPAGTGQLHQDSLQIRDSERLGFFLRPAVRARDCISILGTVRLPEKSVRSAIFTMLALPQEGHVLYKSFDARTPKETALAPQALAPATAHSHLNPP